MDKICTVLILLSVQGSIFIFFSFFFLYLPFTCIFFMEPPMCPGVQLAAPAFTLSQGEVSCCQGAGMTLAGLWEQCRQQSLVLCPTVPSPDWAGRPRSQGMQGRAKPTISKPACVQSHHPAGSSRQFSLERFSVGSGDVGGFKAGRGRTTEPTCTWQAVPTSRRCPAEG